MSVIYALTLRGDQEIRYIGSTQFTAEERLAQHLAQTRYRQHNPDFCNWLNAHADEIEAHEIATFKACCRFSEKWTDRLANERAAIERAVAAGHRLFNVEYNPTRARTPIDRTSQVAA